MDDILYKSLLFDFYGKLLTEKQRSFYEMYYFDNLTLSEIGAELGVTLQAAGDIIRRTEKNLSEYEQKLGMVSKYENQKEVMKDLFETLDLLCFDNDNLPAKIEDLKTNISRMII